MGITPDRRNDIGMKITYVSLTILISLLLTIFFTKTYEIAEAAFCETKENKKDIAVLSSQWTEVNRRLLSIDGKLDEILHNKYDR